MPNAKEHRRAATIIRRSRTEAVPASVHIQAVTEAGTSPSVVVPSRRALLSAFIAKRPVASGPPSMEALDQQFAVWGDEPAVLRRTSEGRSDSASRYHNAEEFFASVEEGFHRDRSNLLYQTGIVMQLGLSSHLLDVGFDDRWCAHNLGHRVAKSLAYANATGLEYDGPEIGLLAAILTPYWKWNSLSQFQAKESGSKLDDGPFSHDEIRRLTRALLDHVRLVTGHPRPQWREVRHV